MTFREIATAALVAPSLLVLAQGSAQSAILCDGNFQVVNGLPISTPYCREINLARVARSYGWRVSDQEIRHSESTKAQVCRAIGHDNRVFEICSPYRGSTGSRRR